MDYYNQITPQDVERIQKEYDERINSPKHKFKVGEIVYLKRNDKFGIVISTNNNSYVIGCGKIIADKYCRENELEKVNLSDNYTVKKGVMIFLHYIKLKTKSCHHPYHPYLPSWSLYSLLKRRNRRPLLNNINEDKIRVPIKSTKDLVRELTIYKNEKDFNNSWNYLVKNKYIPKSQIFKSGDVLTLNTIEAAEEYSTLIENNINYRKTNEYSRDC